MSTDYEDYTDPGSNALAGGDDSEEACRRHTISSLVTGFARDFSGRADNFTILDIILLALNTP